MTPAFFIAAAALVLAFTAVGVHSGRRVRDGADFALAGRRASAGGVSGVLLGALIGGASTVGTAELAYSSGLTAWWFTLGGGLGCLVLGVWFARPLRRSGLATIAQFLEAQYGRPAALVATLSAAAGTFLSVVAQFLACTALLRAALPIGDWTAAATIVLLVLAFIVAGGLRGYAALGKGKVVMLYLVLAACALRAPAMGGMPSRLWEALPHDTFFRLFGRGAADLGAATSLVVGVLCTQIYVQAVLSAADERTARKGALLSALLMPPLGALGIWVGLTLKASGVSIPPAQALPYFIRIAFPPAVAGLLWGAVLLTSVGAAAGLAFGIATNLARDLYLPWRGGAKNDRGALIATRVAVAAVVGSAALVALGCSAPILNFSFLSMGLRGAGTFFPLITAALWPGKLAARWALAASAAGVGIVSIWTALGLQGEPLFAGLGISGLIVAAGIAHGRERPSLTPGADARP